MVLIVIGAGRFGLSCCVCGLTATTVSVLRVSLTGSLATYAVVLVFVRALVFDFYSSTACRFVTEAAFSEDCDPDRTSGEFA